MFLLYLCLSMLPFTFKYAHESYNCSLHPHTTEPKLTDSDIARTQYKSIRVNTMNMLELFGSAPPGSIACTSFRNIQLDSFLTFSFKGRITLIAPWPSTPTADGSVRLQPNIVSYETPNYDVASLNLLRTPAPLNSGLNSGRLFLRTIFTNTYRV